MQAQLAACRQQSLGRQQGEQGDLEYVRRRIVPQRIGEVGHRVVDYMICQLASRIEKLNNMQVGVYPPRN